MSQKLAISEVFYSIQGEGKTVGIPSVFVRLGGCNLMCGAMGTQFDGELHNGAEFRCDTIEVWMKATSKNVNEILDKECLEAIKQGAHIILTGGEPTMQQKGSIVFPSQYGTYPATARSHIPLFTGGPTPTMGSLNEQLSYDYLGETITSWMKKQGFID